MNVEWTELSDYLAGELDADTEAALERDLFERLENASVVTSFLHTIEGISLLYREHGCLNGVLRPNDLERMRRRHRLVEVDIQPGKLMPFCMPEDASYCIAHLHPDPGSLAESESVDIEYVNGQGEVYARAKDVFVDRAASRVIVACERHIALMEEVTVFRLLGMRRGVARVIGEYGVKNAPPTV